ncbi:MAG TPA: hypothetical protein VKQ36_06750, partial [Ktedonobacterales bacterium]|nr:hypothetical protein [Ktedonobacterales bacterium]
DSWDRGRNLIDRKTICAHTSLRGDCGIPREWPRYLVIDFGYTHPFVCQWYAEDGDGRLYRYREIYMTHRLVEDHARLIKEVSQWGKTQGDPLPRALICDHDAEDRATLERHLGMVTIAAHKTVTDGIQAVAGRWRPAGDGRPRLYYLRDSLIEQDITLIDAKQPTCAEEEVESYIWQQGVTGKRDTPVKDHDHGMDTTRYMVAHRDLTGGDVTYVEWPQ